MKRLLIFSLILLSSALAFASLRVRKSAASAESTLLDREQTELALEIARLENEHTKLHKLMVSQQARQRASEPQKHLSPALADWLLAGDFSNIPDPLVPEFRAELNLPAKASSDFVLISKATLATLNPPSPGSKDTLPGPLCALLSISPQEKQEVQSALSTTRN